MTTRPAASPTRWDLAFLAMLVLALAVCLIQTVAILRFRDPQPIFSAGVGQRVTLNGVGYTLEEFVVGPTLDAKPGQDPVTAMPNAALVGVELTIVVDDPSLDTATLYCRFTLVDDRGRRWTPDHDVRYRAALPERTVCGSGKDRPVVPGVPYQVGAAFTVPADAADRIRLRLELPTDRTMIEFRR
jgi:hypothetical protein